MNWGVFLSFVLTYLILSVGSVSAEIKFDIHPKESYYVGESITTQVEYNIKNDSFITGEILCNGSKIEFYTEPIKGRNETRKTALPSLGVNKKFYGGCKIISKVKDYDGTQIGYTESRGFEIKDTFYGNLSIEKNKAKPGEKIGIVIFVNRSGDFKAEIRIIGEREISRKEKSFSGSGVREEIQIGEELKAGLYKISINVMDAYGNRYIGEREIEIESVPKKILLEGVGSGYPPNSKIVIIPRVYDQVGSLMEEKVIISLMFDEEEITRKEIKSGNRVEIEIERGRKPGIYRLIANAGQISNQSMIKVEEKEEIRAEFKQGMIIIDNIGNVKYQDRTRVSAKSGNLTYVVPLTLDLNPGESLNLKIDDDLPPENYIFEIKSREKEISLEGGLTNDERPVNKIISQKIGRITGNSVIDTSSNSGFFWMISMIFVLGMVIFYLSHRGIKASVMKGFGGEMKKQEEQITLLRKEMSQEQEARRMLQEMLLKYRDFEDREIPMEEKEISSLFCDLRGFTKMFSGKNHVEITNTLKMYMERTSSAIHLNSGNVNKFVGDAVMALFNTPRESKEHEIEAVKAGLQIQKEISNLNKELIKRGINPLEVGIGIASGKAAVGTMGSKEKKEYTAIGVPVNLAARLQAQARKGQILIDSELYGKIKERVNARSLGNRELKNMGWVEIYEVTSLK